MMQTLEQRITTILSNTNSGSAEFSEILIEVEAAITTADDMANTARRQAVDLVASPIRKLLMMRSSQPN